MSWLKALGIAAEQLAIWCRRKRADRRARKARVQRDVAAQKVRERAYRASVESARRRGR